MSRSKQRDLSLGKHEARRGLYIDFEGFEDMSPSLIGILVEESFEQVVLDASLRQAARAKGLRVATLAEIGLELLGRCVTEQRVIIAFSQHEQSMFRNHAHIDIEEHYRNARIIGQRFLRESGLPGGADAKSLQDMLKCIGHERAAYLGQQKSTKRLRGLLGMLPKKGTYGGLTRGVKGGWTKLLTHNELDCREMRELVERAVAFRGVRQAGAQS